MQSVQYLNLSYTPGFPSVYTFTLTTDFGVDIDVTLSAWTFEVFKSDGTSLYLNTVPLSATGNQVVFTIPNQSPQIFLGGNYAYRVAGTNTTTHVGQIYVKGFLTVEPAAVLS